MEKDRAISASAFLLLLLLMSIFSSIPIADTVNSISPWPIIIRLEESKINVSLDGTNDSIASVIGSVNCHFPSNYEQLNVTLSVNPSGFDWSPFPSFMIFTDKVSNHYFTILITVPHNTSSGIPLPVSITGKWEAKSNNMSGGMEVASCILVPRQYYKLSVIQCENTTVRAGNDAKIPIRLLNEGNGADRPRIQIDNLDHLISRGWEVQLSQDKCSLPANRMKVLSIFFHVPSNEVPGTYEIKLIIISAIAESLGEISCIGQRTIEVKVLNNYKDELITAAWISAPLLILVAVTILVISLYAKRNRS